MSAGATSGARLAMSMAFPRDQRTRLVTGLRRPQAGLPAPAWPSQRSLCDPGFVTDLCMRPAVDIAGMLRRCEVSAREVVSAHIARIEAFNPVINAIVTRTFDAALARAAAADETMASGRALGLLHGLPVAHKDLAETAGVRTTYGSPLFATNVPQRDALVVQRMAQAGAISLGKTNVPELGAGSHTVNPVFGATRNPYDHGRSAGGSSGGAAAALAARLVALADGSDLGGSLRNPASFCNVVGLRPSPGRVPGWPLADVADMLGVPGPMGRTVADAALLLAVLSGPDPRVPLALDQPPPAVTDPAQILALLDRDLEGTRIAWSPDLGLPVEPDVLEVLAPARKVLAGLGAQVADTAPDLSGADEVFRTFRAFAFATFRADLLAGHPDLVGPNVAWNIRQGLKLTTADLSRATVLRAELAERISAFFAVYDVLACPVSQVAPFSVTLDWVHEINGQPQLTYLDWMASAYQISATGLPAVSVPAGFTRAGLPVGLQLVGRRRGDWDLLAVARAFESATGCAARVPASAPSLAAAAPPLPPV
jgi:amidase